MGADARDKSRIEAAGTKFGMPAGHSDWTKTNPETLSSIMQMTRLLYVKLLNLRLFDDTTSSAEAI